MTYIELLSPAKDLECGKAAIDHGADAVYIGATNFGARQAASNSLEDIRQLTEYAHRYLCKVYVTVNTILYDNELEATRQLICDLYNADVDAILVQDMSILGMDIPKIDLHASTQTDNRSADKVKWLRNIGFKRAVLARELSIDEIAAIHRTVPDMPLEVFVHGALCVSYSGLCYASQYCFGRSANRGECAQFCRMKFSLTDSDGKEIEHDRHLLSLKDMAQIDNLEALMLAGATSFKIEGRLKGVDYVKNVTAAYSERLNEIISRNPDKYQRASIGKIDYAFTPNLDKTFNRGYTTYFLKGRQPGISSPDTPKAMGEYVGTVKEIRGHSFNVAGLSSFSNGDGLCFINSRHQLEGFRVNRVENNRLFPLKMPDDLLPGTHLYRNSDMDFQRLLSRPSADRRIHILMKLSETKGGFSLQITDEVGRKSEESMIIDKQQAQKPPKENIIRCLSKLGNTPYVCENVDFEPVDFNFFIPAAQLTELRRKTLRRFEQSDITCFKNRHNDTAPRGKSENESPTEFPREYKQTYLYNISNNKSKEFYIQQGLQTIAPSFEQKTPTSPLIMQCRHCIRYSLGYCIKNGGDKPSWREPLYLSLGDGKRFRLEFDCKECKMNIYAENG